MISNVHSFEFKFIYIFAIWLIINKKNWRELTFLAIILENIISTNVQPIN
jgi:hypothetical protein